MYVMHFVQQKQLPIEHVLYVLPDDHSVLL